MDLRRKFGTLAAPTAAERLTLTATRVRGFPAMRLARTPDGNPALLVEVAESGTSFSAPPVLLTHLSVEHRLFCRVESDEGVIEQTYSLVRVVGGDPALGDYFLDVLPAIIQTVGARPTIAKVNEALARLVELFQALSDPPRKSVQGLWAELYVLDRARNAAVIAAAWHGTPEERFDFSSGPQRIEIKSALGRRRAHHFSLEQLRGPPGIRILVGSVLMDRASGGTTLGALLARVRAALATDPKLTVQVDRVVAMGLGSDLPQALNVAFDEHLAEETLEWFWAEDIPSVDPSLPRGVSAVHFVADLEGVLPAERAATRTCGGIFAAL